MEKVDRKGIRYLPWEKELVDRLKSPANLLRHARTGPGTDGFIAMLGRRLLGYAAWEGSELVAFEVAERFRGQGIGTMLLRKAIRDGHVSSLSVDQSNDAAIALYRKLGFGQTGFNGKMIFMTRIDLQDEFMRRMPALAPWIGCDPGLESLCEKLTSYIDDSWRSKGYRGINWMGGKDGLRDRMAGARISKRKVEAIADRARTLRGAGEFDRAVWAALEAIQRSNASEMPKDWQVPRYTGRDGKERVGCLSNLSDACWSLKGDIYQLKYDMIEIVLNLLKERPDSRIEAYLGTDNAFRNEDGSFKDFKDGRKPARVLTFKAPGKAPIGFHLPTYLLEFVQEDFPVKYYDDIAYSFQPNEPRNVEVRNWRAYVRAEGTDYSADRSRDREIAPEKARIEAAYAARRGKERVMAAHIRNGAAIPAFPLEGGARPLDGIPERFKALDPAKACVAPVKSRGRVYYNAFRDAGASKDYLVRGGDGRPVLFDDYEIHDDCIELRGRDAAACVTPDGEVIM